MNIEEIFIKNLYFFMKTVIMYGRENNCRTMFSKGIEEEIFMKVTINYINIVVVIYGLLFLRC